MAQDTPKNISTKTREKAIVLAENARKIGLHPGTIRFNSKEDFMSFWFTNGLKYIIVFCSPYGYLAEIHTTKDSGDIIAEYSAIKNIRHFLYHIRKQKLVSFENYFEELAELADMNEGEVEDIVQQFMNKDD